VHLGVRDGLAVVYVDAMRTRMRHGISSRVGDRWPMHATGTGFVLLAHASSDLREKVLSGHLARFSPYTITDPDELRRALATIRQTGLAVAHGQISPHHTVVAAPIHDACGAVCAAISVVIETGRARPRELGTVLRRSAEAITHAIASGGDTR
jgi:DNA-binding IclR family transcriptional regulator